MTEAAIEIDGARKLRKAFKDIDADTSDFTKLHRRLANDVAGTAKTKVPVRSGRLQRSIRGGATKTSARVMAGNNRKGGPSSVPYAAPIHFGWASRGIRPQPFLYEALDDRRQDVVDRYNDEVRAMIRRAF
tara:strand:- start:5772 stop:6164 length:393 start_codon:yes stop_codon:yes gene_type:complete